LFAVYASKIEKKYKYYDRIYSGRITDERIKKNT